METVVVKGCMGRPFRTIIEFFVNDVKLIEKDLCKRGITHDRTLHATDEAKLIKIVKSNQIRPREFQRCKYCQ